MVPFGNCLRPIHTRSKKANAEAEYQTRENNTMQMAYPCMSGGMLV
jgi:hypothetical protein